MNTTFHMTGIQHAYSSLALTSHGTTLHVRIGFEHLKIPMGSTRALAAAMQQLRCKMIVTPGDAVRICATLNSARNDQARATVLTM
jgi:3-hydroxymyristoyl/3-hydroxydecanoyl-(acyl carrier protein) dehydratase